MWSVGLKNIGSARSTVADLCGDRGSRGSPNFFFFEFFLYIFIYFLNYIYILFILSLYYEIIIKDKIKKFNGDIDL